MAGSENGRANRRMMRGVFLATALASRDRLPPADEPRRRAAVANRRTLLTSRSTRRPVA